MPIAAHSERQSPKQAVSQRLPAFAAEGLEYLADSKAIEAMAEAQDDQEAATQAELKSSRVSYRLVRRDAAEFESPDNKKLALRELLSFSLTGRSPRRST